MSRWITLVLAFTLVGTQLSGATFVEGISDQQTVSGTASFLIRTDPEHHYQATLNGDVVTTDVLHQINLAGFYELNVTRRELSTNIEDHTLIRFVVLDEQRGDPEWGLFPWTPPPIVHSAAGEFAGAELKIVLPTAVPTGMPIPVIALVETPDGEPVRVNGTLQSPHLPTSGIRVKRGVGSGFISPQSSPGELAFDGSLPPLSASRTVQVANNVTWTELSGTLETSIVWPEHARIHITGDLIVQTNATLTIERGTILKIAHGADLYLHGRLVVNGTMDSPVLFTPANPGEIWGGFILWQSPARVEVSNAIFTGSGEDATWFTTHNVSRTHRREQATFFLGPGTEAHFTNSFLIANAGQAFNGNEGFLTLDRSLVQGCQTVGEINGGSLRVYNSALLDFPSDDSVYADADNDALYLTSGSHEIKNTLVGWCKDDGIDAGASDVGQVLVENCWIEACFHEGMALSGNKIIQVKGSVVLNCGQGIETGYDAPNVNVERCLLLNNETGARLGDNYTSAYYGFLRITNSFLLHNYRDVWGMVRNSWTEALAKMDVQSNWLSAPNLNHPKNLTWTPASDGPLLAEFRSTPGSASGISFHTPSSVIIPPADAAEIPVGLSSFSPVSIGVMFRISRFPTLGSNPTLVQQGQLDFLPGEVLKQLHVPLAPPNPEIAEVYEIELLDSTGGSLVPENAIHRLIVLAPGKDSDGDQLPDVWENILIQFDPADDYTNLETLLPGQDFDGDGVSNGGEYIAGTNAASATDYLRFSTFASSPEGIRLEFEGQPDRAYRIEFQDAINETWQLLAEFEAKPDQRIESTADSLKEGVRFYRLVVVL